MTSLLITIDKAFTPEFVGHLAARLGEGQAGVRKALSSIVPVVLSGLIAKASTGDSIYALSQRAYRAVTGPVETITAMLGILGSGAAPDGALAHSERMLEELFACPARAVVNAVGAHAGIRPESANALLVLVGAVLLALLGQQIVRHRLNSGATASLLISLKAPVRAMLPPGLDELKGLLWPNESPARVLTRSKPGFRLRVAARQAVGPRPGHRVSWFGVGKLVLLTSCLLGAYLELERPVFEQEEPSAWNALPVSTALARQPIGFRDSAFQAVPLAVPEPVSMRWVNPGE